MAMVFCEAKKEWRMRNTTEYTGIQRNRKNADVNVIRLSFICRVSEETLLIQFSMCTFCAISHVKTEKQEKSVQKMEHGMERERKEAHRRFDSVFSLSR